jgi:hypothetical protein
MTDDENDCYTVHSVHTISTVVVKLSQEGMTFLLLHFWVWTRCDTHQLLKCSRRDFRPVESFHKPCKFKSSLGNIVRSHISKKKEKKKF